MSEKYYEILRLENDVQNNSKADLNGLTLSIKLSTAAVFRGKQHIYFAKTQIEVFGSITTSEKLFNNKFMHKKLEILALINKKLDTVSKIKSLNFISAINLCKIPILKHCSKEYTIVLMP